MIVLYTLAGLVTLAIAGYLVAALVKPELFH